MLHYWETIGAVQWWLCFLPEQQQEQSDGYVSLLSNNMNRVMVVFPYWATIGTEWWLYFLTEQQQEKYDGYVSLLSNNRNSVIVKCLVTEQQQVQYSGYVS